MLGVHEGVLTPKLREMVREGEAGKISYDEMTRAFGTMLALRGNAIGETRTGVLHRTIAFANTIARSKWYTNAINSQTLKTAVTRSEGRPAGGAPRGSRGRSASSPPPPPPEPSPPRTEIACQHLDGSDQVIERIAALQRLQAARGNDRAEVVCNVGLFSEGVDVPSLNAVAFLDPKTSAIDIVQAVGRVMRRPERTEDKDLGYVIVPVVVPEGSSLREALTSADGRFKPILDVIAAFQSHDEDFLATLESKLEIHEIKPGREGDAAPAGAEEPSPQEAYVVQTQLQINDEDRQGIVSFLVEKTGFGRRTKGRIVADGIKSRVTAEAAKMLASGIGAALGRLLSIRADKNGSWKESCTVAALVLLNAMLVHRRLRRADAMSAVKPLYDVLLTEEPATALEQSWQVILEQDYRPIFEPTLPILRELGDWRDLCRSVLAGLVECANTLGPSVSEMGWDHAGPLYHTVLGTAKADGAYYTNNVSALMLARLAIRDDLADWQNPASISKLRIMDPACGTGTMLMAVLQELKRRAKDADPQADLDTLHRALVEHSIAGLDINPTATQLAASNLTISSENVDYNRINVYRMKKGVQPDGTVRTGSLEILDTTDQDQVPDDLFQKHRELSAIGAERSVGETVGGTFPVKDIDLVIMNPPFTNAEDRDDLLREREGQIRRTVELRDPSLEGVIDYNSISPFFTPLADLLVRKDVGTIAKVAPASACTNSMGLAERRWIAKNWHLETVVSNHDPKLFTFSESTSIHEVLIVCRRPGAAAAGTHSLRTRHISLSRRPQNEQEALECVGEILSGNSRSRWFTEGWISKRRAEAGDWSFVQWHQPDLERVVQSLENHPALVALDTIATLGPTGRQTRGAWTKCEAREATASSFYSKSQELRRTLRCRPEQAVKEKGARRLDWSRENNKAGNLLVAAGTDTISGRVLAVYSDTPAFGSSWQPVLLHTPMLEPAVAGWLNSTPGRLVYLNRRARKLTFPQFSSKDIAKIPVPKDPAPLNAATRACWNDEVAQGRNSADCPVRIRLDEAAAEILGVPAEEVAEWRRLLAQEPTVSGRAIAVPDVDVDLAAG